MNQTTNSGPNSSQKKLPPGQQWVAEGKWPVIGERKPAEGPTDWKLKFDGQIKQPATFSIGELQSEFSQVTRTMDIHCVTRWSMPDVAVEGILLKEVIDRLQPASTAQFVNFVARSERGHSTSMRIDTAVELETLIAFSVNGAPIPGGHGGPIRNIVPGRYFYKSVKWLEQIEFLEHDRPGFWEAESGYHNEADPWKEQRYMAPTVDRRTAAKLIESRDFSGHDLRSIRLSGIELNGLKASGAMIRDGRFDRAQLENADFSSANLSNADLRNANLRGADFTDGDLEGTDFCGADLRGARFDGAYLTAASFIDEADIIDEAAIADDGAGESGSVTRALIDETTSLPASVLTGLTPRQLEYVLKQTKQS